MSFDKKSKHTSQSLRKSIKKDSKGSVRQEIKTMTRQVLNDLDSADEIIFPTSNKDINQRYW